MSRGTGGENAGRYSSRSPCGRGIVIEIQMRDSRQQGKDSVVAVAEGLAGMAAEVWALSYRLLETPSSCKTVLGAAESNYICPVKLVLSLGVLNAISLDVVTCSDG